MNYNYDFNDYSFTNIPPYRNMGFNVKDNYTNNNISFNATNMTPSNNMIDMTNMGMNMDNNINHNLANSYEGFIRGNLFNNLYDQYKNYRPFRLSPSNEMAEALLKLDEASFAAHDLRLYLDIYPNDSEMIELFNKYRTSANQALKEYENKFGPITWDSLSGTNEFGWVNTAWPWEMEVM